MKETIKEAQELLSKKSEWRGRYDGYAKNIDKNKEVINSNRRRFNEFPPLYFYISTTAAKEAKTSLLLDVRYRGQSVATLKANADTNRITLSTKEKDFRNKRDFNCTIELDDNPWDDTQVREFRRFFKSRDNSRNNTRKKNEEHNVEHLLLTEFSKRNGKNKQIKGIQPVKICGNRFGMPTPSSASNHNELKYGGKGGGIDIFARTGRGRATYLTVIEVKDENKPKEPPKDALKQAIQYAVFIRELLRSDCGGKWYKIFGFKGAIPKNLTIRAVCAMPDDNSDLSFAKQAYLIGNDIIECHYIYFKYDGKQLSDCQTSLFEK